MMTGTSSGVRARIMACICGRERLWVIDWRQWAGRQYTVLFFVATHQPRHRSIMATIQRCCGDVPMFSWAQVGRAAGRPSWRRLAGWQGSVSFVLVA